MLCCMCVQRKGRVNKWDTHKNKKVLTWKGENKIYEPVPWALWGICGDTRGFLLRVYGGGWL